MLSYMLPVDEKPPPGPGKNHLQLALGGEHHVVNGRATSTPMSKDTSVSSFASDATTATASHSSMTPTSTSTDKGKPKLMVNGKHPLKRVSFGSSKGSMVETLIFESPVQEEPEPSPIPENGDANPFPEDQDQTEAEREKVRVKFFQQSKPQEVDLPDEPAVFADTDYMMATQVVMTESNHVVYTRTESTESGWDNPFRPGGDLSREADEIVELIKGGKPITPTPGGQSPPPLPSLDQTDADQHNNVTPNNVEPTLTKASPNKAAALNAAPKSANGNVKNDKPSPPGAVDVQRGTIRPDGDASQVEHVTIKKKPKCKCCVIQ
ncbi:uncharacterized protein LOC109605759 [Aethina tumida]|uniref:uncharacterized protein LOC109605759 n=1 Tax=Aethina tumida TaxID=116153 RepID=UPI002148D55E|nr:uncharacterized protein LOC109605759 [Aethina tumida]